MFNIYIFLATISGSQEYPDLEYLGSLLNTVVEADLGQTKSDNIILIIKKIFLLTNLK